MTDARFEDGEDKPLRLLARDEADLQVVAALTQDAVLTGADMRYQPRQRRFSLLLNRFRWEDEPHARAENRRVERVRAILDFADVTSVAHQGIARDADTVLSLLSVDYAPDGETTPGEPAGPGRIVLTFAGDGAIALNVECIEAELSDVTRPYAAPSGHVPSHQV